MKAKILHILRKEGKGRTELRPANARVDWQSGFNRVGHGRVASQPSWIELAGGGSDIRRLRLRRGCASGIEG